MDDGAFVTWTAAAICNDKRRKNPVFTLWTLVEKSDTLLFLLLLSLIEEMLHHINGQREDDGRVLLSGDARQRLKVPGID